MLSQNWKKLLSVFGILVGSILIYGLIVLVAPVKSASATVNTIRFRQAASANRIAYLSSIDTIPLNSPEAPEKLNATNSILAVHSWNEVVALHHQLALDALIIHSTALAQVDKAWTAQAYRDGLVLVVFDGSLADLVNLTGDQCLGEDGFGANVDATGSYILAAQLILTSNPQDAAYLDMAYNKTCDLSGAGAKSFWMGVKGKATNTLSDDASIQMFFTVLNAKIAGIHQTKVDFNVAASNN